jgi:endonuclease G
MKESNLLTNICPQDRGLNSGLWNVIERDCRKWAKKYGDLYIVCGPVFLNREHEVIGKNKVVVPEAFFKVILCLNPKLFVNSVQQMKKRAAARFYQH